MSVAPQSGGDPPTGLVTVSLLEKSSLSREMHFPLLLEPTKQTHAPLFPPSPAPSGSASYHPEPPKRVGGLKLPQVSGLPGNQSRQSQVPRLLNC